MNAGCDRPSQDIANERLDLIERRLSRLEQHLRLAAISGEGVVAGPEPVLKVTGAPEIPGINGSATEEDLGASCGSAVVCSRGHPGACPGGRVCPCRPYPGSPPALPSILGYVVAGGLLVLARAWKDSFQLISSYLRGAAMALFYFSTLRLSFLRDHLRAYPGHPGGKVGPADCRAVESGAGASTAFGPTRGPGSRDGLSHAGSCRVPVALVSGRHRAFRAGRRQLAASWLARPTASRHPRRVS